MRIYWFFIWRNLNPLHPRMLCAKFGWNWPSGSREDFLISLMFRTYFIISPWKRAGPFIWTNLNPLYPRMLCAKFGWNWSSGSGEEDENVKNLQTDRQTDVFGWNWLSGFGEEDFLNFVNTFSLFSNYLPFEKGGALHLNKLESPLHKDALCQVWLKLARWFWRRSRK